MTVCERLKIARIIADHVPRVRALEWTDIGGGMSISRSSVGTYMAWVVSGECFVCGPEQSSGHKVPGMTLDAAKAAAKADFERRVSECLEPVRL